MEAVQLKAKTENVVPLYRKIGQYKNKKQTNKHKQAKI